MLPVVMILFGVSFFAKPRRKDSKSIWFLRLHFFSFAIVGEISYVIYDIGDGDMAAAWNHVGLAILETVMFHYGLKLRELIGQLPDKQLGEFLTSALFKGGFKALASVLFVIFRSFKCVYENESDEITIDIMDCGNSALCASFIGESCNSHKATTYIHFTTILFSRYRILPCHTVDTKAFARVNKEGQRIITVIGEDCTV